uniref:Uncharacterized protein n=1 Tax=Arundo donax TaxID=35708 RepID=A0A0A8XP76_ARUDO
MIDAISANLYRDINPEEVDV